MSEQSTSKNTKTVVQPLSAEEKKSFEELISFCDHEMEQVRITALSNLVKFVKLEAYIKHLRYTIRLMESCVKVLVKLLFDKSNSVSKLAISSLILLSQDESTLFFNEMVKHHIIDVLMRIFGTLEKEETKNTLSQNNKETMECILLLLSNLTASSEQARVKFLKMKTIEDTMKNLKKRVDSDSESDEDSYSDTSSDSDVENEPQDVYIKQLINYFNRPVGDLKISLFSSHLIPTILANITVNDHAKHAMTKSDNGISSHLHTLLFNNRNIELINNTDEDIQNDKCLRRGAILSILKNCLFDKRNMATILFANRMTETTTHTEVVDLILYQLNPKFPPHVQNVASECLILISNTPFGVQQLSESLENIKKVKCSSPEAATNISQVVQSVEQKDMVKVGSLVRVDEDGQMVNVSSGSNIENEEEEQTQPKKQVDYDDLD